MLGTLLIVGALGALVGAAIHAYWKNIIQWLAKVADKIKSILKVAVEGSETFIKRIQFPEGITFQWAFCTEKAIQKLHSL